MGIRIIVVSDIAKINEKYEGGGTHRLTAYAAAALIIIGLYEAAGPDDCFIICIGGLNSYRFYLIFTETEFETSETIEKFHFSLKHDTQ